MTRSVDSPSGIETQTSNVFFRQTLFAAPASYGVEVQEDGYRVTIPVAICSQNDRVVSIITEMHPTSIENVPTYELSFSVLITSMSGTQETFTTQDRRMARAYLPGELPALVMTLVCASINSLIENVRPDFIYRVTKGINLPERAMKKHHMVTGAVQGCGYAICDNGTDPYGRTFWLMENGGA